MLILNLRDTAVCLPHSVPDCIGTLHCFVALPSPAQSKAPPGPHDKDLLHPVILVIWGFITLQPWDMELFKAVDRNSPADHTARFKVELI